MDTKQLRQKILDLAIRGKLVPQDPNDEPASVLLERVKAEKERLIAEGKIKRSKKSAASSDKPHYPFEIPSNWIWATLECICSKIGSGSTPRGSNYAISGIPFFRSQNIYNDGIELTDIKYISEETHKSMISTEVLANDVLLNITGGSLGRCAVVPSDFLKGNVSQHVCILRPIEILPQYIHCFILSSHFSRFMRVTGSGREGLPKYNLEKMLIPIPPIKEQTRIINKVKEWMTLVITIEKETSSLQENLERTKSLILEQAIKGKLVPQDPADEPAADLLKRVNPNAVVSTDTSHYALPTNWAWVKGKDLFLPMKSTRPTGYTFKYIDIDSIDNVNQCISAIKVLPSDHAPSRASRFTEKGNILFSMVRPYLRNIAIVTEEDCIASTGFYVCRQRECLDHKYLYYLMTSNYVVDGLNSYMKGDNSPSINKGNVDEYVFPLPPLNEQKRIASKVDELFAVIDQIQQSLE